MWEKIDKLTTLLINKGDIDAIRLLNTQIKHKYAEQISEGFNFTTICEDEILELTAIYSPDRIVYDHLFVNNDKKPYSEKYILTSLLDEINFMGYENIENKNQMTMYGIESIKDDTDYVDVHLHIPPPKKEVYKVKLHPVYLIGIKVNGVRDIYLLGYEKLKPADMTYIIDDNPKPKKITEVLLKYIKKLARLPLNHEYTINTGNITFDFTLLHIWDDRYDMIYEGYASIKKEANQYKYNYLTCDSAVKTITDCDNRIVKIKIKV